MSNQDIIAITMPKWGMAMESGTIVQWNKREGEVLTKGEEIADVETEKITSSLESQVEGVLSRCVADEGEELPVGALLAVVTQGNIADALIDAFVSEFNENFIPEELTNETDIGPAKVTVNDIDIAYRRIEAQHLSDTTPILFLHGFGGDQKGWLFNTMALSEHKSVITVDLPGHGESAKILKTGSLQEFAETVSSFLVTIEVKKVHLVGHSLGAAIAVKFAGLYPEKTESLTLISGAGPGTIVNRDFIEGFITAKRRKDIKPYLQRLFADKKLVNHDMIENALKGKRIEGVQECMQKVADTAIFSEVGNPVEYLNSLDVPVQILFGELDEIVPLEQFSTLPGHFDQRKIKNAGHMIHIEAASIVNDHILEFTKS